MAGKETDSTGMDCSEEDERRVNERERMEKT